MHARHALHQLGYLLSVPDFNQFNSMSQLSFAGWYDVTPPVSTDHLYRFRLRVLLRVLFRVLEQNT